MAGQVLATRRLRISPVICNAMFKAIVFPAPGGPSMNTIGQNFIACTIVALGRVIAMAPIAKMAANVLIYCRIHSAGHRVSLPGYWDSAVW